MSITHNYRRSRAKKCRQWERYVVRTDGMFITRLAKIALRYPRLTPTQLRVASLCTACIPSWEIAHILGNTERNIEKIRSRIHKTLAIPPEVPLQVFFCNLLDEKK